MPPAGKTEALAARLEITIPAMPGAATDPTAEQIVRRSRELRQASIALALRMETAADRARYLRWRSAVARWRLVSLLAAPPAQRRRREAVAIRGQAS